MWLIKAVPAERQRNPFKASPRFVKAGKVKKTAGTKRKADVNSNQPSNIRIAIGTAEKVHWQENITPMARENTQKIKRALDNNVFRL